MMIPSRQTGLPLTRIESPPERHLLSRSWIIAGCLVLQTLCAIFFVGNIVNGVFGLGFGEISWQFYELIEIGAALGLLTGITVSALALRRKTQRVSEVEQRLRSATGQFMDVVHQRFDEWTPPPAERDVALFTIKGLSTPEIAELRSTSAGTVKVQTIAVYRKAGVSGRPQLLSVFIDELMDGVVIA